LSQLFITHLIAAVVFFASIFLCFFNIALMFTFRSPHPVHSPPGSPHLMRIISSQSLSSLSPSITPTVFHSRRVIITWCRLACRASSIYICRRRKQEIDAAGASGGAVSRRKPVRHLDQFQQQQRFEWYSCCVKRLAVDDFKVCYFTSALDSVVIHLLRYTQYIL